MNNRWHQKSRDSTHQGTALVMTIITLAMITVLVLGVADVMRNETVSSSAHNERNRAQLFSQMGVDIVIGVLRQQTADPNKVWASRPGALMVPDSASGANPFKLTRQVDLHTGVPSAALLQVDFKPEYFRPPNLNVQTLSDQTPPTYLITDQAADPANGSAGAVKLPVRWVYVRKDGSLDYAEQPALNAKNSSGDANPLVGRFAYWVDDESCKINLNTSWKRNPASGGTGVTNKFSTSHPSSVNLAAIPGFDQVMADTLHGFITPNHDYKDITSTSTTNRFFNSSREPRILGASFTTALNASKFEITHYNHDPNTTFFNEPRIVLTTRPDRAGWTYKGGIWVGKNGLSGKNGRPLYIRCLANEGSANDPLAIPLPSSALDPGLIANLDNTKVSDTIKALITYLQRTDWPMVSGTGASIQKKYYDDCGYPSGYAVKRLAQLAINIIDYVRSKESPTDLVEPLREGQDPTTGDFSPGIQTGTFAYMGLTRAPRINEIGVWQNASNTTSKLKYELYLPPNYGLEKIDVTTLKLFVNYESPTDAYITSAEAGGQQFLNKGGYILITHSVPRKSPRPAIIDLRIAISNTTSRLNIAPIVLEGSPSPALNSYIHYPLDGGAVLESDITSIEVDDPRLNSEARNWIPKAGGKNTFGAVNSISSLKTPGVPTVPSGQPQQDTDANGKISTASLYMPPPAGKIFTLSTGFKDDNTMGMVTSVGELGYIPTGIESSNLDIANNVTVPTGIPWRTLRLQPSSQGTSVVPDWAFMDLFSAPVIVPVQARGMFAPHDTMEAGRINVNAQALPYGDPAQFTPALERKLPLTALLQGVPKNTGIALTSAESQSIAGNIYNHTLAQGVPNGKSYPSAATLPSLYDSPGEVVEIKGVADSGEDSEAIIRGISNLITARGSVFTIYTIGQAIQETRGGQLRITAEQRHQTMLERYDDFVSGTIRFRNVTFRDLTP